jgi:quinoprotein glucose dehydrogenase
MRSEGSEYRSGEVYKGGPEANNYSALDQINSSNVQKLEVAWTFYPNDAPEGFSIWKYECNPIVVDQVMYIVSAWRWLYALNAVTGDILWSFDPLDGERGGGVSRGVTYWKDPQTGEARIFFSARNQLFSIDASTGLPDRDFGENGSISLGIRRENQEIQEQVRLSTPGIIYENLIIVGATVSESSGAAPGDVRAFNTKTGALEWTFHTIPLPGEYGHDTWPEEAYQYAGAANNWAGMSLDEERGLVYVPTGSPTYD